VVVEENNKIYARAAVVDGNHRVKACRKILYDASASAELKKSVRFIPAIVLSNQTPLEHLVSLGTGANVTSRQQLQDTLLTRSQLLRNIATNVDVLKKLELKYRKLTNKTKCTFKNKDKPLLSNGIAAMVLKQQNVPSDDEEAEREQGEEAPAPAPAPTSAPAPERAKKSSGAAVVAYVQWALYPCLGLVVELEKNQVGETPILTYSKLFCIEALSYADAYWTCGPLSKILADIRQAGITDEKDYSVQAVLEIMRTWYRIVNLARGADPSFMSEFTKWFDMIELKTQVNTTFNLTHKMVHKLSQTIDNVIYAHKWFLNHKDSTILVQLRAVPGAFSQFEKECMDPSVLSKSDTIPVWAKNQEFDDDNIDEKITGYLKSLLPNAPSQQAQGVAVVNEGQEATPTRSPRRVHASRIASPVSVRRSHNEPVTEAGVPTPHGTMLSPQRIQVLIPSPAHNCIASGHVQGITHTFCKHLDVTDEIARRVSFEINGRYAIDALSYVLNPDSMKTPTFLRQFVDSLEGHQKVRLIFANPPWGIWKGNADAPLQESDIIEFANAFDYILDDRGTVLLQPGPNPEHIACWYKALTKKVCEICLYSLYGI